MTAPASSSTGIAADIGARVARGGAALIIDYGAKELGAGSTLSTPFWTAMLSERGSVSSDACSRTCTTFRCAEVRVGTRAARV